MFSRILVPPNEEVLEHIEIVDTAILPFAVIVYSSSALAVLGRGCSKVTQYEPSITSGVSVG